MTIRSAGYRAAASLLLMEKWFPRELTVTAGFTSGTGAIEIQLHDSHQATVKVADGYRLAGWLFGAETYDFHDVETQRHHQWRGVYNGLQVIISWVETRTPERLI